MSKKHNDDTSIKPTSEFLEPKRGLDSFDDLSKFIEYLKGNKGITIGKTLVNIMLFLITSFIAIFCIFTLTGILPPISLFIIIPAFCVAGLFLCSTIYKVVKEIRNRISYEEQDNKLKLEESNSLNNPKYIKAVRCMKNIFLAQDVLLDTRGDFKKAILELETMEELKNIITDTLKYEESLETPEKYAAVFIDVLKQRQEEENSIII